MSHARAQLKPITRDGIAAALLKADQYRVLNEPIAAESICLDVLAIDPGNADALKLQVLAITDQFIAGYPNDLRRAEEVVARLDDPYSQTYHHGMICERWAKGLILRAGPSAGEMAHGWVEKAMDWYEKAEAIRPAGNDDAILRWNSCVRLCERHRHVAPRPPEPWEPSLE